MKTLLAIPLLALFAVPLGLGFSRDLALHSPPSLSIQETKGIPDDTASATPSQARTSTVGKIKEPAAVIPEPKPVTPSAPVEASADTKTSIETEVLRLTNKERAKQDLSALAFDAKLSDIAAGHSADMLANDYFEHEDLNGCSSSCRVTNGGYRWQSVGENIYMMSGYKLSPEKAAAMIVDGWMNSPGHRANILGTSFTYSGVGVVSDGESIYATALYAKPR